MIAIRETILEEMDRIASDAGMSLPPLGDDLVLLDSGLDSLSFAILVARLEETLELDPFTDSDDVAYPVTLGDFIAFYERAGGARSSAR